MTTITLWRITANAVAQYQTITLERDAIDARRQLEALCADTQRRYAADDREPAELGLREITSEACQRVIGAGIALPLLGDREVEIGDDEISAQRDACSLGYHIAYDPTENGSR